MGTDKGSPSLPCDLLLEVLARCDHETLVRCAASSRLLCRCMLDDPAILRPRGVCTGAFAPSLLLGAFVPTSRGAGTCFVEAPAPDVVPRGAIRSFVSETDNADLLVCFDKPVACRGGLVVLRRDRRASERRDAVELCVCNPMTGQLCFLASSEVHASSVAVLIGEDAGSGSAFQLLAVDLVFVGHEDQGWGFYIRSQLFSSRGSFPAIMPTGAWGPVRRVLAGSSFSAAEDPPVVINRVAHWLITRSAYRDYHVFALDVDEGCEERIEVPRELAYPRFGPNGVLLASTPDRRLSIVVVEEQVVSMFVLLPEEFMTWERRVVVVREGILAPPQWMRLDSFGERSGTVVIAMASRKGRLLLNLETKEVMHMSPESEEELPRRWHLYEMDLPSLTAALLKSPESCAASSKLSIKFGQVLATIDTARFS